MRNFIWFSVYVYPLPFILNMVCMGLWIYFISLKCYRKTTTVKSCLFILFVLIKNKKVFYYRIIWFFHNIHVLFEGILQEQKGTRIVQGEIMIIKDFIYLIHFKNIVIKTNEACDSKQLFWKKSKWCGQNIFISGYLFDRAFKTYTHTKS